MLSPITTAATAASACAGSPAGAFLAHGSEVVTADGMGGTKIKYVRPRAVWAADVFGHCYNAAGQGVAVGSGPALGLQTPSVQHPQMTRAAAAIGGGLGPHPARDPV